MNNYEGYTSQQQQQHFDPQQYERQHNNPLERQQPSEPVNIPYTGSQSQQAYTPPMGQNANFYPYSMETGKSFAGLCYLGCWVTGLLFLLFERKNRLVRFHAMQSLLFFGGVNVLYIVLIPMMNREIPFIHNFAIFAFVIMNIVAVVAWIVGMVNGFKGRYTKLPFVGDFAERFVNGNISLK